MDSSTGWHREPEVVRVGADIITRIGSIIGMKTDVLHIHVVSVSLIRKDLHMV